MANCVRQALITLVLATAATCNAADLKAENGDFGRKLGLFDVSSSGNLVVLEEPLPRDRIRCQRQPCDPYRHRIIVKEAATRKTTGELKVAFEGFRKVTIAFVPGTEDVLLRGRVDQRQNQPGIFFLWTPSTQEIRPLGLPASEPEFEFIAALDRDEVLGRTPKGTAVWNHKTDQLRWISGLEDFSRTAEALDETRLRTWWSGMEGADPKLFAGGALGASGLLAVVAKSALRPAFPADPCVDRFSLMVYDVRTKAKLLGQPLFEQECRDSEAIEHVATQVVFNRAGDTIALSYERQKAAFGYERVSREPRWLVIELPSGREIGVARHRAETVSEGVSVVSSAASGNLRFSPDGRYLYTTSRNTLRWRIR